MPKKKKQNKWIKFRHTVVRNIAYCILYPYSRLKYGVKVDKFKAQGKRPYLILLNHQTGFDQFFVGMAFKGPIYYLASEDIFSMGFVSSLLRYLVAPIPIKKQATDVSAVMNCLRVAREGGTIAIAPEGNRTYSGKTEYMSPAIASLARKMKLPILLYRIEGGYGVHPRWSDVVRRGKMHCYVSRVIEPEEYSAMSDDELFEAIRDGLYVNESVPDGEFFHKKRAEYLERAMYVCPYCGLSTFESKNEKIKCTKCEREIEYTKAKQLCGVGFDFPFSTVSEWYDYQKEFANTLDTTLYTDEPIYREAADVYNVIVYKKKSLVKKNAAVELYGDKIVIGEDTVLPFDRVSAVAVLGKNKLNIYQGTDIYQLKGNKRFNALKYVNIFHRHKNTIRGEQNGKLLEL